MGVGIMLLSSVREFWFLLLGGGLLVHESMCHLLPCFSAEYSLTITGNISAHELEKMNDEITQMQIRDTFSLHSKFNAISMSFNSLWLG
jgi:hypothetical protein